MLLCVGFSQQLYIPLWYDSNRASAGNLSNNCLFTFHSGTILMFVRNGNYTRTKFFTFHSGTILIGAGDKSLPDAVVLYIPLWYDSNRCNNNNKCWNSHFTFHSGTILIVTITLMVQGNNTLHSTLVRF